MSLSFILFFSFHDSLSVWPHNGYYCWHPDCNLSLLGSDSSPGVFSVFQINSRVCCLSSCSTFFKTDCPAWEREGDFISISGLDLLLSLPKALLLSADFYGSTLPWSSCFLTPPLSWTWLFPPPSGLEGCQLKKVNNLRAASYVLFGAKWGLQPRRQHLR